MDILDAVKKWAEGYWLLREFDLSPSANGRIDAILVPVQYGASILNSWKRNDPKSWWNRHGLVGVEVKTNRADYLRGIRENQFNKYSNVLSGIYLAAPKGIVKTSELPEGVGHLVETENWVSGKGVIHKVHCARHPQFHQTELPNELLWKIINRQQTELRSLKQEFWKVTKDYKERMGRLAETKFFSMLKTAEQQFVHSLADRLTVNAETVPHDGA